MSALNLTVRFLCELAALAAVGWWGWTVTPVLGVVLVLAVAGVWGAWIAPKARRRLADPLRFAVELAIFTVATACFAAVGRPIVAAVFAVAAAATAILVRKWPEAAAFARR